jgi:hypothetical protein
LLGYRILELNTYAIAWLFLHPEIHSSRRSLACFLVNAAEVILCFAAFYCRFSESRDPSELKFFRSFPPLG